LLVRTIEGSFDMATIRKEATLSTDAKSVWSALRDFGAVHEKVAPGFVTQSVLDGDSRIVTFANGTVARERLVSTDDDLRRLVYAVAPNERIVHHNASVEIEADGPKACRLIWTTDVLPAAIAPYIEQQMAAALKVMKPTLER
jgi:hypothetical protein